MKLQWGRQCELNLRNDNAFESSNYPNPKMMWFDLNWQFYIFTLILNGIEMQKGHACISVFPFEYLHGIPLVTEV